MSLSNVTKSSSNSGMNVSGLRVWRTDWRTLVQTLIVLFKLRVVFLLLMAATGGAFMAAGGWPGLGTMILVWVTGGSAAAGASAWNQYLERNKDGKMGRTHKRPLVTGAIANPVWVPYVATFMIIAPVLAVLPINPSLSFWLFAGAVIYVGIYTIWLKPRTLLNVVVGGAAGSAAVLSGSAAAGNWASHGALLLALVLFLWSPFHFWSLALLYRDEYARADVPMLPTQTTPRQAAWWVLSHTLPTGLAGLGLAAFQPLGLVYFIPMLLITGDLLWRNIRLILDPSPLYARNMFISSNIYLLVLILFVCLDSMLPF
ncbi:MAG: protoheme IX farnesyltransferase [Ardenticatenaceae bacterium]|nr:heme o synthase [Anaerolineales bacterium]MCB8921499.1 protoheme IX farnesyltransferase [Ardenticatenaceae bacterium]MCB8990906.1 protoheme IX farnesyltransferase [Ardenticatenaceae bacterium]MCB9004973.1 protoheme IX farnesyltransferase [Ardenticatenaceae bacterium]